MTVQGSAPAPAESARELSFDRTAPRAHAHVRALAEVFVADSLRVADDEFQVAVQLPRSSRLWSDHRNAGHDPLVCVEVSRQAAFLVAHHHFGVPGSAKFVLQHIDFQVLDLGAFADDGIAPPEGVITLKVSGTRVTEGVLTGMVVAAELRLNGVAAMRITGDMTMLDRTEYELMRAHSRAGKPLAGAAPPATDPVPAHQVGRFDERNVVIAQRPQPAEGRHRWDLLVDTTHPELFDHPHDHITGSLMIEMCRQSAIATAYREGALRTTAAVVTRCRLQFEDFGEPEALATDDAEVTGTRQDGTVQVHLDLHQMGDRITAADLELVPARSG